MWTAAARERYTDYEPGYAWGFRNFQKTEGYVATGHARAVAARPLSPQRQRADPACAARATVESGRASFYRGSDLVDPANGGFVSAAGTDGERYGLALRHDAAGQRQRRPSLGHGPARVGQGRPARLSQDALTGSSDGEETDGDDQTTYLALPRVDGRGSRRSRRCGGGRRLLHRPVAGASPTPVRSGPSRTRPSGRSSTGPISRPRPSPYFAEMDKGLLMQPAPGAAFPAEIMEVAKATGLEPEAVRQAAIRGQNTWIVWTGGNDRFWDFAARTAIGSFDLLKIMSSHPSQAYGRWNRFRYLGLINEPCFKQPDGRRRQAFRPLDRPARPELSRPTPSAATPGGRKYQGVKIGARGKTVLVGPEQKEQTRAGRLLLWRADRCDRPAPVPQSRFRRGGRQALGRRALLRRTRATTTTRTWCARIASACPAPSAMSDRTRSPAQGPGKPALDRADLQSRRAVFLGRPHLLLEHAAARQAGRACARTRATSSSSCSTPTRRARSTPRSSRPTT